MGRMLGSLDNPEGINRPDLNQCPDCLCYFQDDYCPLCGKLCPEEMRAGNRKKVKDFKFEKNKNSNRVTFVLWYHSWVAILLFFLFMPIVGIVLLITSPHKTKHKLIFVGCIVLAAVILTVVGSLVMMLIMKSSIGDFMNSLTGTSSYADLSREEYIAICEEMSLKALCKYPDDFVGDPITIELIVYEKVAEDGQVYYACSDEEGEYVLIVRDRVAEDSDISTGDVIVIYGECAGDWTLNSEEGSLDVVIINMFYYDVVGEYEIPAA